MSRPLPLSRREALMEMPGDTGVRVYTWQHPGAWTSAQERGYLTGQHEHTTDDPSVAPAYAWMRDQMAQRIPGFSGDLPVWGWLKSQNPRRDPDLRETVRITAIVPRERLLLSDYMTWHMAMNDGPVHLTEVHDRTWPEDATLEQMRSTWPRVFDITDERPDRIAWMGRPELVQACIDRIMLDEVVNVRQPTR